MLTRKKLILLLVPLLSSLPALSNAQLAKQNPGGIAGVAHLPSRLPTVLLFDQTDNNGDNGAPDQDFETANDAFDSEGADDFNIPALVNWRISRVNTVGTQSNMVTMVDSVTVTFFPDNGGTPAGSSASCVHTGLVPTMQSAGNLTLDLPSPCVLGQGTHWLAIQVNQDAGIGFEQHFWSNRTVQSGNPSHWRNPGNGFGSGCLDFSPQTTCGVGGGVNPDFLFSLEGVVEAILRPGTIPSPGDMARIISSSFTSREPDSVALPLEVPNELFTGTPGDAAASAHPKVE